MYDKGMQSLSLQAETLEQAGKIRSKLALVLQEGEEVVIQEGSSGKNGKAAAQYGMRR
jgi:hypothetical protein